MLNLYRQQDHKEYANHQASSELTRLQQQIKQLETYNKVTQQEEIKRLLIDIKKETTIMEEKTNLTIEEKSALSQAQNVLNQFDQELKILHKDIKNNNSHSKKDKEKPTEYLAASASSLKSYLNELITKESTDNASIQLLGETFISTTDAMRTSAQAELSKSTSIEKLTPDVRNTTASVISESLLALYGKLLSISGGLTADYKIQKGVLASISASGSVGSLESLYAEAVKQHILTQSQQNLFKTILNTPVLKKQREEQYKTAIKPIIDSQIGSFGKEYDDATYSYKLSKRVTNKGSDMLEGGKNIASKGIQLVEKIGDGVVNHPVSSVLGLGVVYGVWNWLFPKKEKEEEKKADKRTRFGWMNDTLNPWNRGWMGKAAVIGGAGYLSIKAGNTIAPIWKDIQKQRDKISPNTGKETEKEKTENKEEKNIIPDNSDSIKEEKGKENNLEKDKIKKKEIQKKEKETSDEKILNSDQLKVKALVDTYKVPFVAKHEVVEQIDRLHKKFSADKQKCDTEIQIILDTHHLIYFPEEQKFQPAQGYTRQYTKNTSQGSSIAEEDQKLIDSINIMTVKKESTTIEQKNAEETAKTADKQKQILSIIQKQYPPAQKESERGVFDSDPEPREEPAFQTKLAEQIAQDQSVEGYTGQGVIQYVVKGEAKNFYYYYDRESKNIVIASDEHELKEKMNFNAIEKDIPKNKTPEQAKKTIDTIEIQIKDLESDYKKIIEGKKKRLEEEIKKAEKEGTSPEEIQKMKEAGYNAISEEVGIHNTKMTYLEKAAVRCMLSIPDAQLSNLIKISPKAGAIAKANNRTTNILNKSFSKTALRAGGAIAIGMNLWNVSGEGGMKNAAMIAGETALELTPFAGGAYLIYQQGYMGKSMTGDLTWGERAAASATGVGSLILDFFGFTTLGIGNGLSALLKLATKAPKITKAITQGAKALVRGQSVYLGCAIGSSLYTASVPYTDLGLDVAKKSIYGEEKHHNHSNDAINK